MGKLSMGAPDSFIRRMFFLQTAPALPAAIGLAVGSVADAIFVGGAMGKSGLAAIGLSIRFLWQSTPLALVLRRAALFIMPVNWPRDANGKETSSLSTAYMPCWASGY